MLPQELASAGCTAAVDIMSTAAAPTSARRADSATLGSAARTDTACVWAEGSGARQRHSRALQAVLMHTLRPVATDAARTRSGATAELVMADIAESVEGDGGGSVEVCAGATRLLARARSAEETSPASSKGRLHCPLRLPTRWQRPRWPAWPLKREGQAVRL